MPRPFDLDPEKSLAVTAYLADRSGETMYTILKMVYLSDRLHLERYGRPITGDWFAALPEGACPSQIYDSMEALRGDRQTNYLPGSDRYLEVNATTYDVSVKDMPDMDVLSASDIECLDEVLSILKRRGRWHIRDMAHDDAWKNTERNRAMDFIEIAKTLNKGDVLAKHLETRFIDPE